MSATSPKRMTALASIVPTSCSTARLLSADVPAGTTHITIQAVGGTLYIRAGGTASDANYGASLASGEKMDLYTDNWASYSVQGTQYAALCYQV